MKMIIKDDNNNINNKNLEAAKQPSENTARRVPEQILPTK